MKRDKAHMRTPLSHVRGLGSAKEGTSLWWVQRLTAVALVPLFLWFVASVLTLTTGDYESWRTWVGEFGNSLLLILLIVVLYHHAQLGLQVIIEDYVHGEAAKMSSLIALKLAYLFCGVGSVLSVLKLSLGS